MTVEWVTKSLDLHSVQYELWNGRVIAEDVYTKQGTLYVEEVDVTNFDREEMRVFLGY